MNWDNEKEFNTFQRGLQFQDFVCDILYEQGIILQNYSSKKYQFEIGENKQGFEIKLDNRCTDTNRLSIEVAEKKISDKNWNSSGIYSKGNSWLYIHGNYQKIFIFSKNILIMLHQSGKYEEAIAHDTVKKFYLPIEDAQKWACKIIERIE